MKILFLLLLSALASCGRPETTYSVKPAEAEQYKYELEKRDCSTGVQLFATFKDTCDGLKNDELNNFCAKEEREDLFMNSDCVGIFSE